MDNDKNLPTTAVSTTTTTLNSTTTTSNFNNDKEELVIDTHKLEKILKDISKKYEHKTQFKQESVAALGQIVESFLGIILKNSDSTTANDNSENNDDNNNNLNNNNNSNSNNNTLTVNEIYKTILDLDLGFLLPDGGITKRSDTNNRINEYLCFDDDDDDDDDDDYDDFNL